MGQQRLDLLLRVTVLSICVAMTGCASRNAVEREPNPDPFEPINRVIFGFNDIGDTYVLRPVARGYEWLVPGVIRTGINNFFNNLRTPVDMVNAFLQGKIRQGFSDMARLGLNTTVGLAGFLDPATDLGLDQNNEDFGQTLGVWGLPKGPYLVIPLFGPRTVRHGFGQLVDLQYHPQFNLGDSSWRWKVNLFWFVHVRSTLLGFDDELNRAFDKYAFVRDAYLQNRRYLRYDGNLPDEDLYFEDEFDEFEESNF